MIHQYQFGPLAKKDDGTYIFAPPIGNGHIPMIALKDLGFWARYSFDNRSTVSGRDLEVASHLASGKDIVEAFKKVTGKKAVLVENVGVEQWFGVFKNPNFPVAVFGGKGSTTWKDNFT